MKPLKIISLYRTLFYFFLLKENKIDALTRYSISSLIRGGTFWGYYFLTLTINISLAKILLNGNDIQRIVSSIPLTYISAQISFMPVGALYGILRELFFDYESTKH